MTVTSRRTAWRVLAGPLAAVMLGLGIVVPLLEVEQTAPVVIESPHAPGSCPSAHDHTICTQVGANHDVPSPPPGGGREPITRWHPAFHAQAVPSATSFVALPRSRAPPTPVGI